MGDQPKTRSDSLEGRIAALTPGRREVLATALRQRRPSSATHTPSPSVPIPRRTSNEALPLSFAQQRLWFLDQLAPGSPFYNVTNALRIRFPLNVDALERSYNETVRRHEALRTTFRAVDGKPVQVIAQTVRLPMEVRDLRRLPMLEREGEAFHIAAEEVRRPFDLAHGPLVRTVLIQLGAADYLLVLGMHHIVSDGWSMDVFAREITELYSAFCRGKPSPLPELPIQYADFALWQREWLEGEAFDKDLAYWKQQLADLPELQLPTDRPRPAVMSYRGSRHPIKIPDLLAAKLKTLSEREDLTLFMVLLTAMKTLLHRYTGQDDIVIGAPIASRGRAELEGLIGFFVNTVVMRTDVSGNPSFRELLARVRKTALEAYAHQDVPFEKLVEEMHPERDPSRNPLFQVCFQVFNVQALEENVLQPHTVEGNVAKFDLRVDLLAGPRGLGGFFEYSTDLFDAATIARLAENYLTLLEAIAADPGRRISQLPLLAPAERRQLVVEWNDTTTEYSSDSVDDLFARQVERSPDSIALAFAGAQLTYGDLNRKANRLARYLQRRGVGPNVSVGIFLERSEDMVVGQLAVVKAGGAYVPLDPEYPAERLAFILEDSCARVLLTDRLRQGKLPRHVAEVICGEEVPALEERDDNTSNEAHADSPACVMYTSGSTGRPKGIVIPHRAITRLVHNTNYISLGPSDRLAQASNASFDASLFEIWGALLNGACLVGVPKDVLLSPNELGSMLKDERITTLFLTTDLFHQLAAESPEVFASLRTLLVGGSPMNPRWAQEVLTQGAPDRLLNVYGPTESTTFASWHEVKDVSADAVSVPIGRPLANTQLYVLDRYGSPAPIGAAGELFIGGDGLARGYLNLPEMTAEKFIANPFVNSPSARLYRTGDFARMRPDGALEFLGRIDEQVKVRGFRVEPGEIETVLRQVPGVRQCVVIARRDTSGPKRLVAYVELDAHLADTGELRRHLKEQLPDYMVPSAFVVLDALPLTPNGKIDRDALMPPATYLPEDTEYAEPRSDAEKTLVRIWAQVLGLQRVGIHDNFFTLGGDSIISIQIIVRAKEAGLAVTLRQLFRNPTVAELAAVAGTDAVARVEQEMLTGDVPLTPIQCWFFEQELADLHHFNQAVLFETPVGLDPALLGSAVEHLLHHHDALRLRYQRDADGWRQFYESSPGPVPFASVDLRAMPDAYVRARVEQTAAEAQGTLDVGKGPIASVVWFDLGERPGRLLFVVHHLAVDAVSWPIMMEDFWRCYEALARREEASLPAKTTSVREWAKRLVEYASSKKAQDDLAHWVAVASGEAAEIPVDLTAGENLAGTVRVLTVALDEQETGALLHETPKAYQTQINDVLVTALTQTLVEWTQSRVVRLDLEGHGREPLFEDVDLTRTVGWFTTIFPVRLELDADNPGDALKSVKEQLRRIPHRGLTYGLLRYLSPEPEVRGRLSAFPTPAVSFNYLGQYPSGQAFESSGPERGARNGRPHLIEIDAVITSGRLQVQWRYSEYHHRRTTVERAAGGFIQHLRALIAYCATAKATAFTPSDFAAARVSQRDLDKLIAAVHRSGERAR